MQTWRMRLKHPINVAWLVAMACFAACSDMGGPVTQGPACRVSTQQLDFGDVLVGESATRSVEISNDGTEPFDLELPGTCSGFAVSSSAELQKLDPGTSATIEITFAPLQQGPDACEFSIHDGCSVSLDGEGVVVTVGADCDVSTIGLDFRQVEVGNSTDLAFTIANVGTVDFSGQVTSLQADVEIIQGAGSYTLAPTQTRDVRVVFSPAVEGVISGSISLGADCGSIPVTGEGTPRQASVSYASQIQPIFTSNCATAGCHSGPNPAGNLSLTQGHSYGNLVGVTSRDFAPALRIAPNDPGASVLYNKVANTNFFGRTMPPGTTGLPSSQVDLIRTWILEGAHDN
jgi:hypothetical protein